HDAAFRCGCSPGSSPLWPWLYSCSGEARGTALGPRRLRVRFGLALPQYGFSLPGGTIGVADVLEWAQRAESMGFVSVWLSDHFLYSFARYGADPTPIAAIEPMSALAAVASMTSRVRLGTLVLCASFRSA